MKTLRSVLSLVLVLCLAACAGAALADKTLEYSSALLQCETDGGG